MATTATEMLTVREVVAADSFAVAELSGQLGYATPAEVMSKRIASILPLGQGHTVLVGCLDGKVVGWVEAEVVRHLQTPPHVLITGFVVKEDLRSLGVGRRLLSEIEVWSRHQGVTFVRVTSRMTRERAHRFYLREGYAQTKTSAVFEKALG